MLCMPISIEATVAVVVVVVAAVVVVVCMYIYIYRWHDQNDYCDLFAYARWVGASPARPSYQCIGLSS